MKKPTFALIPFLVFLSMLNYCCKNSQKSNTPNTQLNDSLNNKIKHSINDIYLKLSRGAFHYDSFVLSADTLSFHPSPDEHHTTIEAYLEKSIVIIEDSIVLNLIDTLLSVDIFNFDSVYTNQTTCNSELTLELKIGENFTTINCHDFIRGCPELFYILEQKLIQLHGKNLKRIILPG